MNAADGAVRAKVFKPHGRNSSSRLDRHDQGWGALGSARPDFARSGGGVVPATYMTSWPRQSVCRIDKVAAAAH